MGTADASATSSEAGISASDVIIVPPDRESSASKSKSASIFHPRRASRTPLPPLVVTTQHDFANGPLSNDNNNNGARSTPTLHHSDSVTTNSSVLTHEPTSALNPIVSRDMNGNQTGLRFLRSCGRSCCGQSAKKIYYGIFVTIMVTASWVGATHCIKYLYLRVPQHSSKMLIPSVTSISSSSNNKQNNISAAMMMSTTTTSYNNYKYGPDIIMSPSTTPLFNAPFFSTWFITNWTVLFFPIYFVTSFIKQGCKSGCSIIGESIRNFRDKGFTAGRFMMRCNLFCMLWVATNYMYVYSLKSLLATDVITLFATNVSSVYLLSWVILHEQFVGVRIVAVIMCDTGVALFAYMDGITGSPTLAGVVLAVIAASGSAVYKVLFKKFIGEASYGQVAFFFSLIGLLNASLYWPLCLTLYLTDVEILFWDRIPWLALLGASALCLAANLLGNFSCAVTYDLFITLGLITAVPVSAALDVVLYGAHFAGMKLAGMILIAVGFFLVMFPENWPDYITRLLRNIILLSHNASAARKRATPQTTQHRQHLLASRGVSD